MGGMSVLPLRGYGPRVFISYSFQDTPIAMQLEAALKANGCQVRREDEVSLFNQRLVDAIPQRIGDAEVLVILLTTAANKSAWVARELDWILEHRKTSNDIVLLPIVFDKATVPEPIKDWWFLDLDSRELTMGDLELATRMCMTAIHSLRISDDDPLSVVESDLETILAKVASDGRRIIFDSAGTLLGTAIDTVAFAEQMPNKSTTFIEQVRRQRDRLVRRLKVLDEVVRRLAIEVMRIMETYTDDRITHGMKPMKYFLRIMLTELSLDAAPVSPPDHPFRTRFNDRLAEARASFEQREVGAFMNSGLYAWVFQIEGGGDEMLHMNMEAPGFRHIRVSMPAKVFGTMRDHYARGIPFAPEGELLTGTYVNYVLPQIALEAYHDLLEPQTIRRDLETAYAWRLDQYKRMGMA
jgi:hypothetical protein